jgi:hypothetical protein
VRFSSSRGIASRKFASTVAAAASRSPRSSASTTYACWATERPTLIGAAMYASS